MEQRARRTKFAQWLDRMMAERNLGVRQAAKYIGIAPSLISSYLLGQTHPAPKTARKIAEYFGVDVNDVLSMLPGIAEEPAHYIATSRPLEGYGPQELRDIARALERAAQILEEQERQRRDQN